MTRKYRITVSTTLTRSKVKLEFKNRDRAIVTYMALVNAAPSEVRGIDKALGDNGNHTRGSNEVFATIQNLPMDGGSFLDRFRSGLS